MQNFIVKGGIFKCRTIISRILLTALRNADKKREAIREMAGEMRKPS